MTPALPYPALAERPAIPLPELVARASLLTRVDRKYLLPLSTVDELLRRLPEDVRVLEIDGRRAFTYHSLYFDTPDLASYLTTAYRRRRRFKVRTRLYAHSAECWLEVKTTGARGSTVKQRQPHDPRHYGTLAPGRAFVDTVLADHGIPAGERFTYLPTLATHYVRTTLYLPDTGSRVTLDTDLGWQDGDRTLRLPDLVVVETKSGSRLSSFDRLLWRRHCRPCRMSKYGTGLAALRPHLPATHWRRTLRRGFARAVHGAGDQLPAPEVAA